MLALIVGWTTLSTAPAVGAEPIKLYFLMDREPEERPQPERWTLNPQLVPMWRRALARPESELKRQAAEAIAMAHTAGHADEMQVTIPELVSVFTEDKLHPAARHAAAHALISLNHRGSAATLLEISQNHGKDLRLLVEPALGEWNYEAIRPIWRLRIASARTPRRDLILAIHGLGQQRDAVALQPLLILAMTAEHPADVRLAAARAAGQIADHGLEPKTEQLLAHDRGLLLDRLCAVSLIARHRSERAITLHQTMGADAEPAVAAAALRSLFAVDPNLVLPLAESALQNPDANVRRIGIETYVALPTPERIQTLSLRLNDPHPELRGLVRDSFHALSTDKALDSAIRQSSIAILAGNDWRGQEQAALLLAALDEESIASRLLELLEATRSEVMVTVAWSLKTIAVADTEAPILVFAKRRTDGAKGFTTSVDFQLAHLIELLGRLKAVAATPLLQPYVPKTFVYGVKSRAAAVWALGVIQEGQVNEPLAKQLMERVMDTMSSPPEEYDVRRASVLTLGRLRATTQLPALKQLIGETVDNDLFELTLRQAVLQISGEVLPIAPPLTFERTGWFLEPTYSEKK